MPTGGRVRAPCLWCASIETCSKSETEHPTMSEALAQRRTVDDALARVRDATNAWEIVWPRPVLGAIGFALERPLYDYLTNPETGEVPRGAAAACVFHRHYRPGAANRRVWQIENEKYAAYGDAERNAFLA